MLVRNCYTLFMANILLVNLLKKSQAILVFTGAGISTSSGIPDYRGPQGVWKTSDPVYYQDFVHSEASRIEYWEQKLEAWPCIRDAQPTATHRAIAALEDAQKVHMVVTQNIDGLHEKAGTSSTRLIEVHGTNLKVECLNCHTMSEPDEHFAAFAKTHSAPLCENCGGLLKPATISFGQSLREEDILMASKATNEADLVISLGSTLSVQPAATIPLAAAKRGVPYVIINRGATDHDGESCLTMRLDVDINEVFPAAVNEALGE